MYTLVIAFLLGAIVSIAWSIFELWGGWWLGSFLGLIVFFATNAVMARRLAKDVQANFLKAQKLAQGGQFERAIQSLEDLLPRAKWQVLLESQVRAQIGIFKYLSGDEDGAVENLKAAHPRVVDAHLLRAAIAARRDDEAGAIKVLEKTIAKNKKQVFPYHLVAWLHERQKNVDAGIEALTRCARVDADNAATLDNLARLKNGQKLNMKQFGDSWYALGFEKHPAAVAGMHTGRRGFRQASSKKNPQAKGKKRKR